MDEHYEATQTSQWELQQKHAGFFQMQLTSVQQAAIASLASTTILFTLAGTMIRFPDVAGSERGILGIAILGWLALGIILSTSFGAAALRIDSSYREEHANLFPGATPYRLESFLLDVARKNPRLTRWLT